MSSVTTRIFSYRIRLLTSLMILPYSQCQTIPAIQCRLGDISSLGKQPKKNLIKTKVNSTMERRPTPKLSIVDQIILLGPDFFTVALEDRLGFLQVVVSDSCNELFKRLLILQMAIGRKFLKGL